MLLFFACNFHVERVRVSKSAKNLIWFNMLVRNTRSTEKAYQSFHHKTEFQYNRSISLTCYLLAESFGKQFEPKYTLSSTEISRSAH